jgi:hypothetical protein
MKQTPTLKYLVSALAGATALGVSSSAHADTLVTADIDGYSSEYSSGYAPAYLFDGSPTVGSSSDLNGEFAANGTYGYSDFDPVVKFSLDSAATLDGIDYAERSDITSYGPEDAVSEIDLYFVSESTYDSYTPVAASTQADVETALGATPSEVINPSTTDINFDSYTFSATSAQYIIAQFVDTAIVTSGNPGGAELRFSEVMAPEPGPCALIGLGVAVLLFMSRRAVRKI